MCAIISSFDKEIILTLLQSNQHRGRVSHSLTLYDTDTCDIGTAYGNGLFNIDLLHSIREEVYMICHLQSPTGVHETIVGRHPSIITEPHQSYLWHNGMLMPSTVKMLQKIYGNDKTFDTYLLHRWLADGGSLDEIEGSFACLWIDDHTVKIFRSRHAKLYIDAEMTLSSEVFTGGRCINADRIYAIDLQQKSLSVESYFKTKRYNIHIQGEFDD